LCTADTLVRGLCRFLQTRQREKVLEVVKNLLEVCGGNAAF